MDNETDDADLIRQHMEETKNSLTEKLETLESQVKDTVTGATEAVTETVQSVKHAVQDTVDTVTGSVQDTFESVKHTFDIERQFQDHPWAIMAGATALGFLVGRLVPSAQRGPRTFSSSQAYEPVRHVQNGNGRAYEPASYASEAAEPARPSLLSRIISNYSGEFEKLGGLALSAGLGIVRDNVQQAVAPAIAERLTEIIDGFTEKLGGKPIPGPILTPQKSENPTGQGEYSRMSGR